MRLTGLKAIGFAIGWLLVGLLVWALGSFGVARGLEDRCLTVALERNYNASSQEASLWPPRLTCVLIGPDVADEADPLEVEQRVAALLRSGWVLGFPAVWAIAGVAMGAGIARRSPTRAPESAQPVG